MRLSAKKIKKTSKINKLNLNSLLKKAGVSKTAYYSLVRKNSVFPKSLVAIADVLKRSPVDLLEDESKEVQNLKRLARQLEKILQAHPHIDRGNAWHTLLLLNEDPVDRLQRSLQRGRQFNFYK